MLSFHNVVARYAFAMGREGLLPAAFGRTTGTSGAPGTGSLLQTAVSLVVVVAFAVTDDKPTGDPTAPVLHLFTWGGNVGALGVILLMAAASLSVIVFFVRRGAAGAQAWRLVASAIAGHRAARHRRLHGQGLRRPRRRGPGLLAELGAARHHRAGRRRRPRPGPRTCAPASPRRTPGSGSATRRSSWRRRRRPRPDRRLPQTAVRSDYGTLTNTRGPWLSGGHGCSNQ